MCFAAAVVVGLVAGNQAATVLWRALLVMAGAWLVGRLVGGLIQHTIEQHLATYRGVHPLPGEGVDASGDPHGQPDAEARSDATGEPTTSNPNPNSNPTPPKAAPEASHDASAREAPPSRAA